MKLLNSNYKLKKALQFGITQFGLELLPHSLGGYDNICTGSSASCRASCLVFTNNARFKRVMQNRKDKTDLFFTDRERFFELLCAELQYYQSIYQNLQIRLNVFSDIKWEDIIVQDHRNLFSLFPKITYYDYTKIPSRLNLNIDNYHLVYSGQSNNEHIWKPLLENNKQVALVFKNVPDEYKGYKVVNGDESDNLIQWKNQSVIVGLKYKNQTIKGSNNKELLKNNKLVIQL